MEPNFYTIEELTKILKLHPKTILRFIHEKKIVAKKIGRSWMVAEEDLKAYAHGELAGKEKPAQKPRYETLSARITVSTVVEISEQNSEEATRLSNSMMAMLNCKDESWGQTRFDFFYFPETEKAKYVFYGSPAFIAAVLNMFQTLSNQKESS